MKMIMSAVAAFLLTLSVTAQEYRGNTRPVSPTEKLNDTYCTGLFKTADGTVMDLASDVSTKGYLNILDWLTGRVAGVQVFTTRTGVRIPVIRGSVPGIYVDEIPVSASYLDHLSVNDLAMIKIIKTPFYGGFNGGGGAIAIYTLDVDDEEDSD